MAKEKIKYYLAPMEGITGYVFRNAYHAFFYQMDKYFTPFISPNQNACFTPKEYRDIRPEHNQGLNVVPQILTNRPADFIQTARELKKLGYQEVNLNLGCPSGTVVSKHKGAGFLGERELLDSFLDEVFQAFGGTEIRISVKTRLGLASPDEFPALLQIFNQYPMEELIIHPRTRQEQYAGRPHRTMFAWAAEESRNPLCYNGDLFTAQDAKSVGAGAHGMVRGLMFGRGILKNPGLAGECAGQGRVAAEKVLAFSDRLFSDYEQMMGEHNAMFRMKELWIYLAEFFCGQGGLRELEKAKKKLKKAGTGRELREAAKDLAKREASLLQKTHL